MSRVELWSSRPPGECVDRLFVAITDREGFWSFLGEKSVVGTVSGASVRLRKRIWYRNSFQASFIGTFEPHGTGTMFRGSVGLHPLVKGGVALWIAGVALGCVGSVAISVMCLLVGTAPPLGVGVPPLMLAFAALLVRGGQYLARDEEQFLIDFVKDALADRGAGDGDSC